MLTIVSFQELKVWANIVILLVHGHGQWRNTTWKATSRTQIRTNLRVYKSFKLVYSSNKNILLETGLLRMFMYAELHVSWLHYCWAPLTYFFHYALWLLRKMTVKSVRCGGRGVSHCSPTLHLHCWWAQRSFTVVSVCKCNYALCEIFWPWALWQCDMHLMLPVSGQIPQTTRYDGPPPNFPNVHCR